MKALDRLSRKQKVILGLVLWLAFLVVLGLAFGSAGRNQEYQPQNEFMLDPWVSIKLGSVDLSINKAVLYLFLAAALTAGTMLFIANRMQQRPNRTQTAVESAYAFMRDNIAGGNMNRAMARKWFPFVGTLFLFIEFSNLIGYVPLPVNTTEKFDLFGLQIPSFAVYAATANISVPLVLALVVWFSYQFEGVRAKGPIGYLRGWVPAGITGFAAIPLFGIEVISQFVRIVSLSIRLFANMLAGHLLILFMAGGLVVLLGLAALGVVTVAVATIFFIFEVVLIATLQAFIFATLAAIYLGEAVSAEH